MLLLQATVKRFQFDLYVNLEGQQMLSKLHKTWFRINNDALHHFPMTTDFYFCTYASDIYQRDYNVPSRLSDKRYHLINDINRRYAHNITCK